MAGRPVLGILTLYLNDRGLLEERDVYRKMTLAARKLGLDLIVFTPDDVNFASNRIHAQRYVPESGAWQRVWTGFPHLIFDRCRIQRSPRFERLKAFRARYAHLLFLNRPIGNKWSVYRALARDARFRDHLPQTLLYESSRDLAAMLKRHPLLYLKPAGGTGGRGILCIRRSGSGSSLIVQGRDHSRRIIRPMRVRPDRLAERLKGWDLRGHKYLVQQGIRIRLPNGRVHDYRLLVQKDGRGEWSVTGCAVRIGPPGSVTSNLHGGGQAARLDDVLPGWLGSVEKAREVQESIGRFGIEVAEYLEECYGPLCELALDLAIDRDGRFWLLEVNPKPARDVFRRAGEKEAYRLALIRPLQYALWLYRNRARRRRTAGRTVGRKTTGAAGGSSGRASSRTIGRTVGGTARRTGRAPARTAGGADGQGRGRTAGRTVGRPEAFVSSAAPGGAPASSGEPEPNVEWRA
jgi:hypothetical protein